MTVVITPSGDNRYTLEGRLEFDTATATLSAVAGRIEQHEHVVLDLSGITAANSAGLALMVEWQAVARKSGKTLAFENIPGSLSQIASVCQVDELLK